MHATMKTTTHLTAVRTARWGAWIASALPSLFLAMDGVMKVLNLEPVVEASLLLGLPVHVAPGLGVLLLACLALYVIPRTSFLGAVLLTGYLGGAVAIHVRAQSDLFSLVFPILIGALLWGGLLWRDAQLRSLVIRR